MNYILEHDNEAARLEKQSNMANYDLCQELKGLTIAPGSRVLDAGCGSGILSRYLCDHYPNLSIDACDISEIRVSQAKKYARSEFKNINFFTSSLDNIQVEANQYDLIICRYVYEHLPDIEAVSKELYRVLKPDGKIMIIDADGLIFDFYSRDPRLNKMLDKVKSGIDCDLFVGRKIPSTLDFAKFSNVNWDIQVMKFQGDELKSEVELNRERFSMIKPKLEKILAPEFSVEDFITTYLEAMSNQVYPSFYNKFIVTAQKTLKA